MATATGIDCHDPRGNHRPATACNPRFGGRMAQNGSPRRIDDHWLSTLQRRPALAPCQWPAAAASLVVQGVYVF